jgi:hypothetical protein
MRTRLPLSVGGHCGGLSECIVLSCYVPAGRPYSRRPAVFAAILAEAVAPRCIYLYTLSRILGLSGVMGQTTAWTP